MPFIFIVAVNNSLPVTIIVQSIKIHVSRMHENVPFAMVLSVKISPQYFLSSIADILLVWFIVVVDVTVPEEPEEPEETVVLVSGAPADIKVCGPLNFHEIDVIKKFELL